MLSLQIVNVFSVFVSGITFGLVPVLVNIPEKFINYIKTFSGGIILGLALIHVIPDGEGNLLEVVEYPISGVFVASGIFLLILINFLLTSFVENDHKHEHTVRVSHECPLEENHNHKCISILSASQTAHISSKLVNSGYIMELGCVFHSFVIGVSSGLIIEYELITVMIIAISFHQAFEALALSVVFNGMSMSRLKKTVMICIYSMVTPAGILVGSLVPEFEDTDIYKWVSGSLNCFSGGLLIYIALYNLLGEEFTKTANNKLLLFGSTLLGFGCMCILAIWA
jgi:zinc transporter 1/2/3